MDRNLDSESGIIWGSIRPLLRRDLRVTFFGTVYLATAHGHRREIGRMSDRLLVHGRARPATSHRRQHKSDSDV